MIPPRASGESSAEPGAVSDRKRQAAAHCTVRKSGAEGIVTMSIANRIGLRVAAAAVATGAIAAGGLAVAGSAGASTAAVEQPSVGQLSIPDPGQRQRPHVQPAARHQRPRSHRRVLRLRRRGPPEQGLPAVPGVQPAQLSQRELPGLGPDPGDRAERPGRHGRVLVEREQRQPGPIPTSGSTRWTAGTSTPSTSRPGDNASPPVDQLLGVNDSDVAVGFYTDGQGNNHGYTYNIRDRRFSRGDGTRRRPSSA